MNNLLGFNKADPNAFKKKGHQYKTQPACNIFIYIVEKLHSTTEIRKPAVPTKDDKPIMGLKSDKNYITANAVDVILMQTKKKPQTEETYLNKKSYGKVPNYLHKLKEDVENEYKTIREMQLRSDEEEAQKR